jgi:UDP-N-acetylglucosamine 2-epimerase (non-hydrolysing)
MTTALVVYGTRPEAIKMAPIITALPTVGIEAVVAVTGQHRHMLDQVNELFGIVPKYDLDLSVPRQTLAHIASSALTALNNLIRDVRPDIVVVQGDTSSTFAGALAAFYEEVPVAHVEAGLRTYKRYSPFPEEINRRLTSQLAVLHLAPTALNRSNLEREGIDPGAIFVTGNTVIDALHMVSERNVAFSNPELQRIANSGNQIVLVTMHRRESWGDRMRGSAEAVRRLADTHRATQFVLPMHLNPVVREIVIPTLHGAPNVLLAEPLPYAQFARLLRLSTLILTDSGGVQEEAPSLGKPVLVLRSDTERPEAVEFGTVRLVGTDPERIFAEASALLDDTDLYERMSNATNPYGDGKAAMRSAAAIASSLGLGEALPDFIPGM